MCSSAHLQCCAAITTGSCPAARGILVPWPEIKPAFPALEGDFQPEDHHGSPQSTIFSKVTLKTPGGNTRSISSTWLWGVHLPRGWVFFLPMMGLTVSGLLWWLSWYRILLQCGRPGFDPWVGKIPWRSERLPTLVFWHGEFHGLYNPWNSPGQNTGVGSLSLLQGIFPTQGSNPRLPYCRWILYQLSHKGSPRILKRVAYPFSSRSSQPRGRTHVSHTAGGFFTSWATREDQEYWSE